VDGIRVHDDSRRLSNTNIVRIDQNSQSSLRFEHKRLTPETQSARKSTTNASRISILSAVIGVVIVAVLVRLIWMFKAQRSESTPTQPEEANLTFGELQNFVRQYQSEI
jgi:hypothetical protein